MQQDGVKSLKILVGLIVFRPGQGEFKTAP